MSTGGLISNGSSTSAYRAPVSATAAQTAGSVAGLIVDAPRGAHGFGYDPHFWLPDRQCTVAELDPAEKNRISHRARALAQLLQRLQGDTP